MEYQFRSTKTRVIFDQALFLVLAIYFFAQFLYFSSNFAKSCESIKEIWDADDEQNHSLFMDLLQTKVFDKTIKEHMEALGSRKKDDDNVWYWFYKDFISNFRIFHML